MNSSLVISRVFRFSRDFLGFRGLNTREIMVGSNQVLERVEKRAVEAEEMIELLKRHIDCLQKSVDKQISPGSQAQVKSLRRENEQLREEANKLKKELVYWEVRNGVKQVSLPQSVSSCQSTPNSVAPPKAASPAAQAAKPEIKAEEKPKQEKKKTEIKAKTEKAPKEQASKGTEKKLDASRFNFRVGKITSVKKHPGGDILFVEEIDVGEGDLRTICTGVVGYIPKEKLQGAMVVVMTNLKTAKFRGVISQGMVMVAKDGGTWSLVYPPKGAVPGDRVVFDAYPGKPDGQLNPKEKIWEQCAPDFTTNADGIPTYKGDPFKVPDKGICTANGIKNGIVR